MQWDDLCEAAEGKLPIEPEVPRRVGRRPPAARRPATEEAMPEPEATVAPPDVCFDFDPPAAGASWGRRRIAG
jgi:hypothetical protein